jgi:adenylate cyclase
MAQVKKIIDEIEKDVIDVTKTNLVHNNTLIVPSLNDSQLTYERGVEKKGKIIKTCVLYVDIRNSVGLTEKHHNQTMGRIYTAFTKAVLKVAREHNGHVRNIIGDRVMIVFPVENCFTNAVDCAISINHISQYIINKYFTYVDFKCGIGIDFGELRVIKVGIQRNGTENGENKGLVWVGYPANLASRLTDNANKKFTEVYYEVLRNPFNPLYNWRGLSLIPSSNPIPNNQPLYSNTIEKIEMSAEEFAESIGSIRPGELYMSGGKFISFAKKEKVYNYPPILMTEDVYKGFKSNNPTRNDIVKNYWKEKPHQIKNYKYKLFGGDVHWVIT